MNRANPINSKDVQTNICLFPGHMLFNITKANFNQINPHVDYAPLRERIINIPITVTGITLGLSFTTYLLMSKIINKYLGDEDIFHNQYLISMLATLPTTLCTAILEINKTKNRTAFYSQNRRKPVDNEISAALQKIEEMIPEFYAVWKQKLNIKTQEELIKHVQEEYKEGMCFGYTIAAIEVIGDYPAASGKELIEHLRYQTVIEKMLLQLIKDELTEIHKFEDKVGFTLNSSFDVAMKNKITQLSYQTPHTDYLNNRCEEIEVKSTTPEIIMNEFYQQAASLSFINVSHYTRNSSWNCARHYVKTNVILTAKEKTQLEALKKQREDEKNSIGKAFHSMKINKFKATLNLFSRKDAYIRQHLGSMSQDTILAGEIILHNGKGVAHSIMFRHSNGLYYFIDSNFGVDEFQSSAEFFESLHHHVMNYYYPISNGSLYMAFIMHALNTKNQLYTFHNNPASPRI